MSVFGESLDILYRNALNTIHVPLLLIGEPPKFGSRSLSQAQFNLFKNRRLIPLQYDLKYHMDISIRQLAFPDYKGSKFLHRISLIRRLVKRFGSFEQLKKYDIMQDRAMRKLCGDLEAPMLTFRSWL